MGATAGAPARPGARLAARIALALATLAVPACRVSPPTNAQWLAVGFRSPEQTFATFQTAIRADDPDLQRRCFSSGFLAANRLSSLNWRLFMDAMRDEQPLQRYGIASAEIEGAVERSGDRARLVATSHGRSMRLDLVLEDYYEVWSGAEPVLDESARFRDLVGIQETADGSRWIYGQVPLPPGRAVALGDVTEITLGREWKIDGFAMIDDDARREARGGGAGVATRGSDR